MLESLLTLALFISEVSHCPFWILSAAILLVTFQLEVCFSGSADSPLPVRQLFASQ